MYQLIVEYDDFIVLDKAPGASIHNEAGDGLIKQVNHDFGQLFYPVHRLDKATSGLLLCAKHSQAASELSQLFQNRQIEKYYLALSLDKPKKKQGLIQGDMKKSRNGNWRLSPSITSPARTQFFSYSLPLDKPSILDKPKRLFILRPYTGKTHQLRVALKSLGSPILGDKRYGVKAKDLSLNQVDSRMYLHAYCLCFDYKGEHYQFSCLPRSYNESQTTLIRELNAFIQDCPNLEKPWLLQWR